MSLEEVPGLVWAAIFSSPIIGGTLLSGGAGNVFGTLCGVMPPATINSFVTTTGLRTP